MSDNNKSVDVRPVNMPGRPGKRKMEMVLNDRQIFDEYLRIFIAKWFVTYIQLSVPKERQIKDNVQSRKQYLPALARKVAEKYAGFDPAVIVLAWELGVVNYVRDQGGPSKSWRIFDEATLWQWLAHYKHEATRMVDDANRPPVPVERQLATKTNKKPMTESEIRTQLDELCGEDLKTRHLRHVIQMVFDESFKWIIDQAGDNMDGIKKAAKRSWTIEVETRDKVRPGSYQGSTTTAIQKIWIKRHANTNGMPSPTIYFRESLLSFYKKHLKK